MKPIPPNDIQGILETIAATRTWNGGAGIIVPEHMAKILTENGITEGYSINQKLK